MREWPDLGHVIFILYCSLTQNTFGVPQVFPYCLLDLLFVCLFVCFVNPGSHQRCCLGFICHVSTLLIWQCFYKTDFICLFLALSFLIISCKLNTFSRNTVQAMGSFLMYLLFLVLSWIPNPIFLSGMFSRETGDPPSNSMHENGVI